MASGLFLPAGFPLEREGGKAEALRNETEVLFSEWLSPGAGYLVPLRADGKWFGKAEDVRRVFVAARSDEAAWRKAVENFLDAWKAAV